MVMAWGLAAAACMVATAGGCKREAPINGIGGFEVGVTTLGQVGGRCTPASDPSLMFCPSVAGVELGNQRAGIDMYFRGSDGSAKLSEILLDIAGCNEGELINWLIARLGEPKGKSGARHYWSNEYVFISAALPADPSRCELNFVAIGDAERIRGLGGPPPKSAPTQSAPTQSAPAQLAPAQPGRQ